MVMLSFTAQYWQALLLKTFWHWFSETASMERLGLSRGLTPVLAPNRSHTSQIRRHETSRLWAQGPQIRSRDGLNSSRRPRTRVYNFLPSRRWQDCSLRASCPELGMDGWEVSGLLPPPESGFFQWRSRLLRTPWLLHWSHVGFPWTSVLSQCRWSICSRIYGKESQLLSRTCQAESQGLLWVWEEEGCWWEALWSRYKSKNLQSKML